MKVTLALDGPLAEAATNINENKPAVVVPTFSNRILTFLLIFLGDVSFFAPLRDSAALRETNS